MQKYSNSGEETNRFSSATMSDLNAASKMMSAQLGSMPPNGMGGMDDVAAMAAAAAAAAAAKQHHLKQARSFDDEDERRANSMPRPQLASMLSHSTTVGQSSDEDDDEDDVYSNSVGGHGSSSYPHHLSQATSHHPHLHTSLSSGGMPTNRQRHESSYSNSSLSRYDSTESPRYPASHHAGGGSTSMDADRNNNSRYGSGGPPPPGMDPHHHHAYGSDSSSQMIKKPRGELTCVVCGAAANGYNFDAITCESCKAFFRRNAFRPINLFRCSNNNACQITVATRKKCKKCRIMKCFNLGMRRDWIMTEVEREEKRRKIAMNKTKTGGPVHVDESSQESTSAFLNDSQYAGSHAGYDQQSDGEMMGGGINNKPIRRRRRRRRAGFGAGPPLDLGVDSQSPHIPSSASYNNMHGYGLNTYGHSEESHHRSPYIPSQHHHSSSHTSPATAHRHPYSPAPSSYYDPRSVQPPGSVGASSAGPYSVDQGGYDELMAKRKRRTMDGLPDDGSMLDGDYLSKSNSNLSSSVAAAGQQRMGLLESYKLSNSDKIVVGQDVEFKTKVTELERTQIDAILEAYKQAIKLVKAHGIPKSSEDINTTINLTELGVRRLIFFFKLISDFRNLDHDLMVKLLKKNMMNLIQIHGVNSYNKVEDTFKEPDSDDTPFAASSLESIYGPDIYKLTIGITQNLFDLCEGDTTYIKVLLLIVLFDPLNEHLSEAERVQVTRLQNKYVTLFHAYMCDSFGTDKGRITFKSVLYEMNKVNDLAQWFEKVVAEKTNYEYVRPLMKEMFNLPHHEGGSSTTAAGGSTTETSTPPASVAAAQTPGVSANALL